MSQKKSVRDITVVICTKNAADLVGPCFEAVHAIDFREVIVVDASSIDGTPEIARTYGFCVAVDPGVGLGMARNIGVELATGDFILNLGPDNTVTQEAVASALDTLISSTHSGVSFVTKVAGKRYLARALNFWRSRRFPPGETRVIGTPSLFRASVLRENPYDASRNYSDDGELCDRLGSQGASFAIADAVCFEHGKTSWGELIRTWKLYGSSDFEHFSEHRRQKSNLQTKVRSLTHPIRVELLVPFFRDPARATYFFPVLATMVITRYSGWMSKSLKGRLTSQKKWES